MILPLFLSLRFLCLFPCLHLCLSKGMWRCGCVVLISSGQGPVMGGREEPERVMERGVVRHTELRPHPVKKKSQKTLQKSFCRKLQKGGKPKTRYSDMKIHTLAAYHQSLTLSGLGGLHCAPLVTYLRINVQIHVWRCWKNLTFPNYEFKKGSTLFTPWNYLVLAKKIKFVRNTNIRHPNFMNPFEYVK